MSPNLTLCILAGVLFGAGVTLLLARSLVRALFGVLLMGNGVNVVFLVASGPSGRAPIVSKGNYPPIGPDGISDPLPQAMVLTAIVITLAVSAFTLALAHRSWQLRSTDEVADDVEGVRAHERAVANDMSDSDFVPGDPALHDDVSPETEADDEPAEVDDASDADDDSGDEEFSEGGAVDDDDSGSARVRCAESDTVVRPHPDRAGDTGDATGEGER